MTSSVNTPSTTFGPLRLGLYALSIISILIPLTEWLVVRFSGELAEQSLLALSAGLIAPVMAPMLIVVILLDVIMSKVHAADAPDQSGDRYRFISRVDTLLMLVMLMFWIPYLVSLTS